MESYIHRVICILIFACIHETSKLDVSAKGLYIFAWRRNILQPFLILEISNQALPYDTTRKI